MKGYCIIVSISILGGPLEGGGGSPLVVGVEGSSTSCSPPLMSVAVAPLGKLGRNRGGFLMLRSGAKLVCGGIVVRRKKVE